MKEVILHGGPFNRLKVPDQGQQQVICIFDGPDFVANAVYEVFPDRPSEGFFLTNEYIYFPRPHES